MRLYLMGHHQRDLVAYLRSNHGPTPLVRPVAELCKDKDYN